MITLTQDSTKEINVQVKDRLKKINTQIQDTKDGK